jgi:1-acyl-sn-glycerol-3-phosphate acyltransferase
MLFARSLLFTTYLMVSAMAWGGVMGLCFFLPYRTQFAIARSWARCVLWVLEKLCGLTYVVEGREHIPPGNHIVMSKHTSAWETVALFLIFPPQVWVLKRELTWIPLMGWGLKRLRPIAINRGAGHQAVNQVIEQGKERLADGLWVIIFPEGTRVISGATRKYGVSGALLATETGHLIVPVSHDAGRFWPRRGIIKKPGTIRVLIGEPVSAEGKNARELNEEIRTAIEAGIARIEQGAA